VAADDSIKQKLTDFLLKSVLPLGGEFSSDNQKIYKYRNLPILKVYGNLDWQRDPKGATYQLNRLRKIAKDFVDKLSFVITSKKNHAAELRDLDIPHIDLPFIIHDLKTDLKYRLENPEFSPESIKSFSEDFLAGKVESYVKSEKVPETNDEAVKVVVGRTFKDIVLDTTKDVLIEAYAPWCGHCKTLEPKYKQLAERMAKYSDSLVIAKIDATANSVPPAYSASGYPTIWFAPANNKDKPIKYDGAREIEDFVNFIKREASLPLVAKGGESAESS
jgi:protein disulfide isomerase family A protein 3